MAGKPETADRAAVAQGEKPLKQGSSPAARTPPAQAEAEGARQAAIGFGRRYRRESVAIGAGEAQAAPPVDDDEQEQPDDVDEVPVPRRRLEADVLLGSEVADASAEEAHQQEARADEDVEAVEAGR